MGQKKNRKGDDDELRKQQAASSGKAKGRSKKLQRAAYAANDRWTTNKLRRLRRHIRRTGTDPGTGDFRDPGAYAAYEQLGGKLRGLERIEPPEAK